MSENETSSIDWDMLSDEDYAREIIRQWGKPIPREWDQQSLTFFKAIEDRSLIESLAKGLTITEALNYFGLVPEILPEYDAVYFVSTFLRGRINAKRQAVDALFQNMNVGAGNSGVQASVTYLKQFADSFKDTKGIDSNVKAIKIEVVE